MNQPATIAELLAVRARSASDVGYVFTDGLRELERVSYAEMDLRARRVAALLRESHRPGARALLLYPQGLDFLAAFFGCLYAGVLAIPAYPPDPSRLGRTLPRLEAIAADADAELVLTDAMVAAFAGSLPGAGRLAHLPLVATDAVSRDEGAPAFDVSPRVTPETLAFVQYTSGSVGDPKGVLVSHANLIHNVATMSSLYEGGREGERDAAGWVPLFHDMGLIFNSLLPLYSGARSVLMSPGDFLRDPVRWLRVIDRYRIGTSGGPNFAYDLCARRVKPDEVAALDLSCWRHAVNSAEPVRADTLARFSRTFAPAGFRAEAFMPCFGMAETTLVVSLHRVDIPTKTLSLDARALESGRAVPGEQGRVLVSNGRAYGGMSVRIVDPETRRERAEGEVGEVWVAGPSVAQGYLGRAELTEEVFGARLADTGEGPFLRTGDMGFLRESELYLTGRRKDVIILRGRNHYPQDIEQSAERAHASVRPGCVNAFSVDEDGEERLVVVAETAPGANLAETAAAIALRISDEHELQVHRVVFLAPKSLPKTSSGKLQRRQCRAELAAGTLPVTGAFAGAELVLPYLRARVAALVGTRADGIALDRPLASLGVDSLAMAELGASLERSLGVPVSLTTQAGSTLTDLAARLGDASDRELPLEVTPEDHARVSPIQEAIWRDHTRWPGSHCFSVGLRFEGVAHPDVLGDALHGLAAAHPILRSAFSVEHGVLTRRTHARADEGIGVRVIDARRISDDELRARMADEALQTPAVERGETVRAHLYTRADETVAQLQLHHLVYDAATLLGVVEGFIRRVSGETASEPEADYARFVAWERLHREAAVHRIELPPSPFGHARVRTQDQVVRTLAYEPLTRRAAALGVTPYVLVMSAWTVALRDLLGAREVAIGTATSLRDEPGHGRPWGPVFNYVAVRADLRHASDPHAAVRHARETVSEALATRHVPFRDVCAQDPDEPALGCAINCNHYDLDRIARGASLHEINVRGVRVRQVPLGDLPVVRPYELNLSSIRQGASL
jgi:acyl-CoA synthetase (AMP-forming)/AMP-acid ligase II/acyl carrier protein